MAQTPTADQLGRLVELYIGYFNRAPEADGLNYWSGVLLELLGQGQTEAQAMATIADQFYDLGIEYEVYDPDMDTEAFIMLAYQNVLGRDLDNEPQENKDEALGWWGPQLEDGSLSKGQFILNLIDAAKEYAGDPEWGWVPKYLEARQQAGLLFAQSELGDIADPDEAIAKGQAVLAPISPVTFQQNPDADPAEVAQQAFDSWKAEEIGQTFTLTKGEETVVGTDGNDTINGVVSALASQRTLDPTDKIDGGKGSDTLTLTMKGAFTGFTTGSLQNVEKVVLNSDDSIPRDFNAKGIEGVQEYVLNADKGALSLSKLGSTDAQVTVNNQTSGTVSIGYDTDVTKGASDEQVVAIHNVGTVKGDKTAEQSVVITADGIETLKLQASGTNVVKMGSDDASTLVIEGDGTVKVSGVSTGLKTFDASAATGAITADLTATTSTLSKVLTGSGDDAVTVDVARTQANAEIDGGDGKDTLILTAAAASGKTTVQYALGGFETIALANGTGKDITFSAAKSSGIETIVATEDMAANATFADLGDADLSVHLQGPNANAKDLILDHKGGTVLSVDTPASTATAASPSVNDLGVTLQNSALLDMTVAEKMEYKGTVIANKADSVTLAIAGKTGTGATIHANEAASVVISQVANKSDLILNAAKATELQVTAAKDLDLSGSNLAGLQALTVSSDGTFKAGDLGKVANVTLSGTGSVELGNLGSTSLSDYGITVTATGLSSGLTIDSIKTGGTNITVDASGVLGKVTLDGIDADTGNVTVDVNGTGGDVDLGTLEAKTVTVNASGALGTLDATVKAETVTITGAGLDTNILDVTASKSATITGGLGDDLITIAGGDKDSKAAFTITTGLGADTIELGTTAGALRVTITDFAVGEDEVVGFTGTNFADANAIATFLTSALGTTVNQNAISVAYEGSFGHGVFVYGGAVHAVKDTGEVGTYDDGDIFITFTGVTAADSLNDLFPTTTTP